VRSVRVYLFALVAISVLATAGAFALVVNSAMQVHRRQVETQTLETAKALSRAVDRELERAAGILAALRASPAARARDWSALDLQARATLTSTDRWIVVHDRQGQQLLNTRLPPGSPLPSGPPPRQMWQELQSGQPRVCNLVTGSVERKIVCVDAPLDGAPPTLAISMIFRPQAFSPIITREAHEQGHIATLVDRTGHIIWRNIQPDRFLGRRASGTILEAVLSGEPFGTAETTSLEGVPMLTAYDRSTVSGWSVVVGVPMEQVGAAERQALWSGSLVALGVLLLSGLLAAWLARRLSRGVSALGGAVQSALDGRPVDRTGIAEFDEAARALEQTSKARSQSERRQQILVGELNHRVKNTLAIVQSLARQTFRDDLPAADAIKAYEGRLSALAGAHNLLTRQSWESVAMHDLVQTALAPFCTADRCTIEGPETTLSPQVAVSLALALHELATNAAKYGALSPSGGHISVRWSLSGGELQLEWAESGGPPVTPPTREGFGMRLIRRVLATELGGRVDIDFLPDGVRCRVVSPVPRSTSTFALEAAAGA
jgi:two-component sensor histidine kinase